MGGDAVPERGGYAEVDGAVAFVGDDVDGGVFFFAHGSVQVVWRGRSSKVWIPAFAGMTGVGEERKCSIASCAV